MSEILTKADFYNRALQELGSFPELAARVQAGDVLITQQIGAISQMLAELSWQIGVAEVEPWTKARDAMVLADATAKGILPFAKAPVWQLQVKNNHTEQSCTITAGRRLLDNKSRIWVVLQGATIQPGQLGSISVQQLERKTQSYEVQITENFHKIEIPSTDSDQYLTDIAVIRSADRVRFTHQERLNNTALNAEVYHILSDESMRLWVEFGLSGVAGYVPKVGERFELVLNYTYGLTNLAPATPFTFEYALSEVEKDVEVFASAMLFSGAKPFSIPEMREMTNAPSCYDANAVYLGDFQFLLMRHLSPFTFLSVWNEQIEEEVRGANIDHMNTLFIAYLKEGAEPVGTEKNIRDLIWLADNSYKVKFCKVVEEAIPITVHLRLSPVHDEARVKKHIAELILKTYGKYSVFARRGRARINWQATANLLKEQIVELQDTVSDISVTVEEKDALVKPESFRYVSESSLNIINTPLVRF